MLAQLKTQVGDALEELRDLGRGIFPPLLAAEGLETALRSQARKVTVPVEVTAHNIGRYAKDVESAVYFCCLEAMQNVSKYAGACEVALRIEEIGDELVFELTDNGCGFDVASAKKGAGTQNMADRLESLDGSLRIDSVIGEGTTITGTLPLADRRVAAAV